VPSSLTVRDLSVDFFTRNGVLKALDRVSFEIGRGEILGLVGESGAGKTMVGSALIGLVPSPGRITCGSIDLSGTRIDELEDDKMRAVRGKRIGMIFQDPMTSLNPLLRIGDQLVETLLTHLNLSKAEAKARAIELLAETGIPEPLKRIEAYPHEFSGGMRQRVVIALALAGEPELIIADEPTTALDVSVQAQIIALIEQLCLKRRASVLLITHDMGVIARAAHRVAVMYAGRIIETGSASDVVRRPLHPYTRGLMSAIPPLKTRPRRLTQVGGSMPRLAAIPPGCAFHPRCSEAMPLCRELAPSLQSDNDREVACHLYRGGSGEALHLVAREEAARH
jgi:peptide/nickel transport system ATP-binding protein